MDVFFFTDLEIFILDSIIVSSTINDTHRTALLLLFCMPYSALPDNFYTKNIVNVPLIVAFLSDLE